MRKLNLKKDGKALLMYHVFKGQTTGAVSELLEKNNIILKKVPGNKTDLFQPLDLRVNKSFKCSLPDNTKPGTLSSICKTRLGSRASWCQSRPTAFGCNVTTCKMGSRILSPYAAQRWKENRRERVSKRPPQGSIRSGHSPSELHWESILKSRHWSFVVQLMHARDRSKFTKPNGFTNWGRMVSVVKIWVSLKETSQSVTVNFDLFHNYMHLSIV